MHKTMGLALALAAVATSGRAAAQSGRACTARDECTPGHRCVDNACIDDAAFLPSDAKHEKWDDKGPIGYVGSSFGLSLPAVWGNVGEAFKLGLRVGVVIEKTFELQLEISPATTVFTNIAPYSFGMFDATGSIGFHIPLNEFTSWIVRFGGGGGAFIGAGDSPLPFGEVRLDFFGVAIRTSKHLRVEAQIPSWRILVLTNTGIGYTNIAMMWVTNVSLDYVF